MNRRREEIDLRTRDRERERKDYLLLEKSQLN